MDPLLESVMFGQGGEGAANASVPEPPATDPPPSPPAPPPETPPPAEPSPPPQESEPPPASPPPSPEEPKSPPPSPNPTPVPSLPPPTTPNVPVEPIPTIPPVTPSTPTPRPATPLAPSAPQTPGRPSPSSGLPSSPSTRTPPSHQARGHPSPPPPPSSDVNLPLLLGATAGLGMIFIILVVVSIICCRSGKKSKRPPPPPMHYYGGPARTDSRPPKGNYSNWGTPVSGDNLVKVPPPSGWQPGVPLSTIGSSGEMSSGPYSGTHGHGQGATPSASPHMGFGFNKSTFSYEELAAATAGFSQANLLGQGGFGYVHKGILPSGKEVAVKSLKSGSGQGEREFQAEVEIISRVHHRHLVSLVGYCIADGQRMLVYEFVPNGTLEYHLHGKDMPVMNFQSRLKIAIGSAKGLAYLHEDCHPKIIHRDIKAANILLDYKFEAMVADFGLARPSEDNNTHVSTRIMGTFGYLAPEYAASGKLTDKSDVFSFGVMLLELVTGRRPIDTRNRFTEDSLVEWARPLLARALEDGDFSEVVDPRLEGNFDPFEMARLMACAAASVRHSARKRPKMSQIVRALEGDSSLDDLNDGVKPGQSGIYGSGEAGAYDEQMRKFRKLAMEEDFSSSEYGATSEYGLNPSTSSSEAWESRESKFNSSRKNARGTE